MFDKVSEPLILISLIVKYKIVGKVLFKQGDSNDVLSVKMLLDDKVAEWFVYAFKFCIEGTIVELYLFDDRGTFNVVMICVKF